MSDPFTDLKNALAPFVGSVDIAGFILGAVIVVFFIVILPWVIDPKNHDRSGMTLFVSAMVGMVISTLIGWFPVWVPFVVMFALLWVILDPMGTKGKSTG